ncbi:prolactin-releasing peptide receptor-like [Amphibalanus amphitrite]|uniref:prolactin-releasing peptide receptor-like n=1 Tax=Amphibalanus amphitrite TaxID=1232801 RepID=UPI001C90C524|nr:prolactin-releasing peptide receptor-like [Amphibalanus amphitrite]
MANNGSGTGFVPGVPPSAAPGILLDDLTTPSAGNTSQEGGEEYLIFQPGIQAGFYVIYSAILLLGITGNCLVMYAVFRNKAMQTVTNYFILNLALSDILLCVLCVPFTPLYTFLQRWIFGAFLCHLVTCTQAVSIYISSLTLTAIAIDRFVVIIHPFRQRMSRTMCVGLIICTWLFSIVASLPYAVFVEYTVYDDIHVCQENFPGQVRLTFGSITTVLQFVIPFLIITSTYTLISLKLSSRARCKPGSKTLRKEQADRERKRRTNRMLIAMVAVFGLSWLPLNLMNILDDVSTNLDLGWARWPYFHLLFFVTHAIAMSSTCYNPFLYAWLNENFRKEFKDILPCFRRRRQSRSRAMSCAFSDTRHLSTTRTAMEPETQIRQDLPSRATFQNNTELVDLRTTCGNTGPAETAPVQNNVQAGEAVAVL